MKANIWQDSSFYWMWEFKYSGIVVSCDRAFKTKESAVNSLNEFVAMIKTCRQVDIQEVIEKLASAS